MKLLPRYALAVMCIASFSAAQITHAFGPEGHRISSLIAEIYLCGEAVDEIDRISSGENFAELGLWADKVRALPPWDDSAPWHYMNIANGESLDDYRSPPEGDVLWAIVHFRERLGDAGLARAQRSDALRFLVHFIVDLHQPLHVGRHTDRGGTAVDVLVGQDDITLHRFWDTNAIIEDSLPASSFLRNAMPEVTLLAADHRPSPPREWAAESLALRDVVYAFDTETRRLDEDYREIAGDVVRRRLILAGLRLADQLNGVFCPDNASLGP